MVGIEVAGLGAKRSGAAAVRTHGARHLKWVEVGGKLARDVRKRVTAVVICLVFENPMPMPAQLSAAQTEVLKTGAEDGGMAQDGLRWRGQSLLGMLQIRDREGQHSDRVLCGIPVHRVSNMGKICGFHSTYGSRVWA